MVYSPYLDTVPFSGDPRGVKGSGVGEIISVSDEHGDEGAVDGADAEVLG